MLRRRLKVFEIFIFNVNNFYFIKTCFFNLKENLNATQFMSAVGLQDNQMNNKKKHLRQSPERKLTKTGF